ncbi:protein kinase [Hamiltosporidium magnivora]|uniref:Protein kinase n=1 Tax=Hamiltosporidium magnivora TaxID=148818 RepID=A0A4Q9L6W3_9MICR|nr:protein kinase [Hamiltosporidium magnivora]
MHFFCKSFLYLLFYIIRLIKASDKLPKPNTMIDKYKVIKEITSGTEGTVFLAIDDTSKYFAIKVYKKSVDIDRLFDLNKYNRSQLKHLNILLPIKYIKTADYTVSIMKYYTYDLFKYKRTFQNLTLYEIRIIMKQILDCVNFLKQKKVLHNDLKIENILINNLDIVIIDFGLACSESYPFRLVNSKITSLEKKEYPYFAPEVLNGELVSHKSDIWCCGVIFYDLICSVSFNPENRMLGSNDPECIQFYESMIHNIPSLRFDADILLLNSFFAKLYSFINCLLEYEDFQIKFGSLDYDIEKKKNRLICKQNNKIIYNFKCFCHNKIFCTYVHKYESLVRRPEIKLIYYIVTDSNGSRLIQHATIDILRILQNIYVEIECFKKK